LIPAWIPVPHVLHARQGLVRGLGSPLRLGLIVTPDASSASLVSKKRRLRLPAGVGGNRIGIAAEVKEATYLLPEHACKRSLS